MIYTLEKEYIPWAETSDGTGICQHRGTACFHTAEGFVSVTSGTQSKDRHGRIWEAKDHDVEPGCLRWVEQPSQRGMF